MGRTVKSESEIIEWISQRLGELDSSCKGIELAGRLDRLKVNSPNESNWGTFLVENTIDWPSSCQLLLPRVIEEARSRFNRS